MNSIMWLRDAGILTKIKDDELSAPIPVPDPNIKAEEAMTVEEIGMGIATYSIGVTLSLLFFIGELCTKKRITRGEKKQWKPREATMEQWQWQ